MNGIRLGPCNYGTPAGPCGIPGRYYACGHRCNPHSPWGLAGQPEPLTPTEIAAQRNSAPGNQSDLSEQE